MPSERYGPRERARTERLAKLRPPRQTLGWNDVARLDEERLWWTMRGLDRDALMVLCSRALAELPVQRLEQVFRDYVHPGDVGAPREQGGPGLLVEIKKFCNLARAGHFYEEMRYHGLEQSKSTELFVAQCNSLFDRAVALSDSEDPGDMCVAFELLMDLMRRVDACEGDIVYFTDEAGASQVHVAWERVLPAYFGCLARTTRRREFGAAVERAISDFGNEGTRTKEDFREKAEEAWRARRHVVEHS